MNIDEERLVKALAGKSLSQGGYNMPDLVKYASYLGFDGTGLSRPDLQAAIVAARGRTGITGARAAAAGVPVRPMPAAKVQVRPVAAAPVRPVTAAAGAQVRSIPRLLPAPAAAKASSALYKKSTTASHGTGTRLSARGYYDKFGGDDVIGDRCRIREDNPEIKCLLKRVNNAPYWASKSIEGDGQQACEDWRLRCKV